MAATKTSDETLQATIAGAHMRGINSNPADRKFPGYAFWGEKGADVASAATLTLGDDGDYFHITGTTTITDIDFTTAKDGRRATLIFDGALTLTHNATTLKLPGGANITTAAGDRCVVRQDSGDNVVVESYTRADGTALVSAGGGVDGYDAVGSYIWGNRAAASTAGSTYAGSSITPAGISNGNALVSAGSSMSGTWRAHGSTNTSFGATQFLRTI